ncbi:MAG TPA: M1 family metallopeptidase [Nitrosopumilaceae archaeon]|nr:M1 family metallopeptidase [Nitrosopumilaceae archaeon]
MIKPVNYSLEFEPNFRNFSFQGKEVIDIKISKPTGIISLNSSELKIKKCHVLYKDKIIKAKPKIDEKNELLVIHLSQKINGQAQLCIDFVGTLNDRLLGFYKSEYKDSNGRKKYLATTQFEAADARRVFPCWDEPLAKATFDITIIADNNLTAISNMPVISKKKMGNKHVYKFSRTPIMSTYLIYLGVGEFEFLSSKLGKVLVRIVTTKGNKSKGKLALDFTKKFLKSYEKYFGIKYPLPKLDMIAVPDFAAGAMENWGAITFRETILLYDPKTSSTKTKQFIAEVISHELAHQWFGNLVTMKWWNDLWLNESFATYMATKIVHEFYPEWDLWDQFLETSMNAAMMLDGLKTSHPIDVKVRKPSEIREIFDSISYDKGGCILRMLEKFVGSKKFRDGLHLYLTKHKYQNATGHDLWVAIGKVSKKPVKSMMNSWIRQVGFPLLDVKKKNSKLLLTQKRFLLEPDKKYQKGTWEIPVSVGTANNYVQKFMQKKSLSINLVKKLLPLVNSSKQGFLRVKYDEDLLSILKPLVENKQIKHIDRWNIQNDLFAICVSGNESISTYLDFSEAYVDEENYLSCVNVANNLNFLYFLSFHESFVDDIKKYSQNYFRHLFDRLGWDAKKDEKHTDTLLRAMVITVLGKLNDKEILDEANKRFNAYIKKQITIKPDLLEVIFSLVAWTGDEEIFEKLVCLYRKSPTQEEKLRILSALCFFKNEKILLKTLKFILGKEVRSQNLALPIIRTASNPYAKTFMWPWLKQNWKSLSKKFGKGNPIANRIVASISLFADDTMQKEIKNFFKKNPSPGTEMTLAQTIERIRINSKFLRHIRSEFS